MPNHILVNSKTAKALLVDQDDNCTEVSHAEGTKWPNAADANSARDFMEREGMIPAGRYHPEPLTETPQ